jgi:hypothetical protein
MITYKLEPRYSPKTGLREASSWTKDSLIDDYTGLLIGLEGMYITIRYDRYDRYMYNFSSEEERYRDDIITLHRVIRSLDVPEERINDYHLRVMMADGDFHFISREDGGDNSFALIQEWLACRRANEGLFKDCNSIGHALRVWRVRLTTRLLEGGEFTPGQLGLLLDQ